MQMRHGGCYRPKGFRQDHMRGVTDEKVQFLLFLVSSFLASFWVLIDTHGWLLFGMHSRHNRLPYNKKSDGEGGPVFYLPSVSERMIRDCPNPIHAFSFLNKETQASKEFRPVIPTKRKDDLPHFKSPDNVGRRQQARDKEISSYHLNLQSEGS
ncbi:hypothetical protein CEXT_424151 [Caerostris extrusa]|uniref:Uncharacterized protein n=1 Tax=Caerostris extrusa TaxID=172846 RepID=A0AAV4XR36_CAEEX|nr:hypothetical protein CEXT_424151 [Caerostris extrusa]